MCCTGLSAIMRIDLSKVSEAGEKEKRRVETLYVEADEDHIVLLMWS